jgi:hypothetical protein
LDDRGFCPQRMSENGSCDWLRSWLHQGGGCTRSGLSWEMLQCRVNQRYPSSFRAAARSTHSPRRRPAAAGRLRRLLSAKHTREEQEKVNLAKYVSTLERKTEGKMTGVRRHGSGERAPLMFRPKYHYSTGANGGRTRDRTLDLSRVKAGDQAQLAMSHSDFFSF